MLLLSLRGQRQEHTAAVSGIGHLADIAFRCQLCQYPCDRLFRDCLLYTSFCGRVENLLEENNLTSGERSSLEKINQALQAEYAKVVSVKQELEEIEEKMSSMSENSVTKDDLTALDQLLSDTIRMELDYSNHMTCLLYTSRCV